MNAWRRCTTLERAAAFSRGGAMAGCCIAPGNSIETQALPARAENHNGSGERDKRGEGAGSLTIVNDANVFRRTISQVEQKAIERPPAAPELIWRAPDKAPENGEGSILPKRCSDCNFGVSVCGSRTGTGHRGNTKARRRRGNHHSICYPDPLFAPLPAGRRAVGKNLPAAYRRPSRRD